MNPRPNVKVVRELASTATVDGDDGLGLVVGPIANQIAIDKASATGAGWVAVRNSHHFGIAGYYPLMALEHDMLGWAMTNATGQVAIVGSNERMLGTNPIAIAFPGLEEPPVVIDLATSAVSYGKIELAIHNGENIPAGWALDSDGEIAHAPADMGPDYALLPLGSDRQRGAHKGYCLGSMVDILCGPLSGANWGPFAPPLLTAPLPHHGTKGVGIGHFFGALRIDGFADIEQFKQRVDDWIRAFRSAKPAPGSSGPMIPGDPERAAMAQRTTNGVPLVDGVVQSLREVGRRTGVSFDRGC